MAGHRYKQYGPDEVACMDCGHEPWQRPTQCPGPHRGPNPLQTAGGGGLAATRARVRSRPR